MTKSDADGVPTEAPRDAPTYTFTSYSDGLQITEKYRQSNKSRHFLIRALTPESLVLESEEGDKPTGKKLTFEARPRLSALELGTPPGLSPWLVQTAVIVIYACAAIGAHRIARQQVTPGSRFGAYWLANVLITLALTLLVRLLPTQKLSSGSDLLSLGLVVNCWAIMLGVVGASFHLRRPRAASAGSRRDR